MSPQSEEYKVTQKIDAVGDMPGADLARDILKISIEDQDYVLTTGLAEALASNDGDTLLVEQATGDTFDVQQAEGETFQVDQSSTFDVAVQNWQKDGDALLVSHDGVIDVSSRDGRNLGSVDVTALTESSPVTASTSSTGSGNAASIVLGALRKDVDIFYDVSGQATLSIEVRSDGGTWRTFRELSIDAAESDIIQMDTAFAEVRVYADQNLNTIEISGKGV